MNVDLTVGGLALVPVIAALCQAAKSMGLPVKYVPVLNAVLSVLAYALVVLVTQQPDTVPTITVIINGIVVALGAAGLYSTAKFINKQQAQPAQE
jgi:hypothetical protein